jgi:hypothetical protein
LCQVCCGKVIFIGLLTPSFTWHGHCRVLIIYIGKARKWSSVWLSKDTCIDMQEKIAAWFPHMKVRQNIHCME